MFNEQLYYLDKTLMDMKSLIKKNTIKEDFGTTLAVGGVVAGGVLGYALIKDVINRHNSDFESCGTYDYTDPKRYGCSYTVLQYVLDDLNHSKEACMAAQNKEECLTMVELHIQKTKDKMNYYSTKFVDPSTTI